MTEPAIINRAAARVAGRSVSALREPRVTGRATLSKWGNSVGFRVPKKVLNQTPYVVGEEFEVEFRDNGEISFSKKNIVNIDELLKEWQGGYPFEVVDWGTPVGGEVW